MTAMKIFVSYSHANKRWLDRLLVHLKPQIHEGLIDVWSDKKLAIGDDWRTEIETAVNEAVIAVLLISPDFLASDFVVTNELPRILERRANEGIKVIPILVAPSGFERLKELSRFQAVNGPNETLEELTKSGAERFLAKVSADIADLVELNQPKTDEADPSPSQPIYNRSQRSELPFDEATVLKDYVIRNRILFVTDLTRQRFGLEIFEGRVFENCELRGPAVIKPIGCTFMDCRSPTTRADTVVNVKQALPVFGVMAFARCNFYACDFANVGFYSDDDEDMVGISFRPDEPKENE